LWRILSNNKATRTTTTTGTAISYISPEDTGAEDFEGEAVGEVDDGGGVPEGGGVGVDEGTKGADWISKE
jgi:hypothetical protein